MKENYKSQDGCNNCKFVFVKYDYDEGETYFCTQDGVKRPLCLSVGMHESPDTMDGMFQQRWNEWDEWSIKREVEPFGICDVWEIKKEK